MILLDLDGPLCNFHAAFCRLFGREDLLTSWPAGEYGLAKVLGLTDREVRGEIDAAGVAFWAEMEPTPWAAELVDLAGSFGEISICSDATYSVHAARGKQLWLERNLRSRFAGVEILTREKWRLSFPGVVLIDDSEQNVEKFTSSEHGRGGLGILFPEVWNSLHAIKPPTMRLAWVENELRSVERFARV